MAHFSRVAQVVVDVGPDGHPAELAFWQEALGCRLTASPDDPEFHAADLPHARVRFLLQRLGAGPARTHLDFYTDDLDAEVERLEKLGAERVRLVRGLWIMRDPSGQPFCVIPRAPGELTEANAQRWP